MALCFGTERAAPTLVKRDFSIDVSLVEACWQKREMRMTNSDRSPKCVKVRWPLVVLTSTPAAEGLPSFAPNSLGGPSLFQGRGSAPRLRLRSCRGRTRREHTPRL